MKEKSLYTPPSGREWVTSKTAYVGKNIIYNSGIEIPPLLNTNDLFGRSGKLIFLGKLSLKGDEPQVCQQHEDVESKWE
jgi:hypothetical protein